ncbi:MAG TPA: amino acid adenylation domain-containing protein [Candidatus Omnitrophota bacterium]|nr:amino acid adenylation domain-containing protein [Candidatus Omnitrophota bacterium]
MTNFLTLHQLVQHSAKACPSQVAISGPDGEYTYHEADQWANRVAHALILNGVKKGDRVGVHLERGAKSLILFQGILRVGAIYVPIDSKTPIHGVSEIISNCSPYAIFTTQSLSQAIVQICTSEVKYFTPSLGSDDIFSWGNLNTQSSEDVSGLPLIDEHDPAYILYTSGSTGKPKGVCLSHKNALSFIYWAATLTRAHRRHVFANHASFSFGISVYDIYVPLLVCAKVVIVPESITFFGKSMMNFIAKENVTHWYSVPTAVLLMMECENFFESIKNHIETMMFAGEPFAKAQVNKLRKNLPGVQIINFYGATETNVSCYHEINDEIPDSLPATPIGKAACLDEIWIDNQGEDPDLNTGELLIKGPTVMLGYWGGELIRDRIYRSKDIVRRDSDGVFHYIGRTDRIVKIKGYRVALSEIEQTILRHPNIREAVVSLEGDGLNAKLVGYATLKDPNSIPGLMELKKLCADYLAPYKIIHKINFLPRFPLNANGKVDIAALINQGK